MRTVRTEYAVVYLAVCVVQTLGPVSGSQSVQGHVCLCHEGATDRRKGRGAGSRQTKHFRVLHIFKRENPESTLSLW